MHDQQKPQLSKYISITKIKFQYVDTQHYNKAVAYMNSELSNIWCHFDLLLLIGYVLHPVRHDLVCLLCNMLDMDEVWAAGHMNKTKKFSDHWKHNCIVLYFSSWTWAEMTREYSIHNYRADVLFLIWSKVSYFKREVCMYTCWKLQKSENRLLFWNAIS